MSDYDHDEISVKKSNDNVVASVKELPAGGESTKITNPLINGKWGLTLQECRLVLALIASLKGDGSGLYSLRVKDLGDFMGLTEKNAYTVVAKTAQKLQDRVFYYGNESGDWVRAHWVSSIEYKSKTSELIFEFSKRIEPLLIDMSRGYTKTSVKELMKFMNFYSARLFLICEEWCGIYKGKPIPKTLEIQELRDMFQTGTKYKANRDFYEFVVKKAVDEINHYTDIDVSATPIRIGHSFRSIEFVVQRKDKSVKTIDTVAIPCEWTEKQKDMYNVLAKIINDEKYLISIVSAKSLDYINTNYKYVYDKHTSSPLKNFAGFLRKALDNNYAGFTDNVAPVSPVKQEDTSAPPAPDNMPGSVSAPDAPPAPKDIPKSDVETEKAIKNELAMKFSFLNQWDKEAELEKMKKAILADTRPEIQGRYLEILEYTPFEVDGDGNKLNMIAHFLYRMLYPNVIPINEPPIKRPVPTPEADAALQKLNDELQKDETQAVSDEKRKADLEKNNGYKDIYDTVGQIF